jgi:hypothetical protein
LQASVVFVFYLGNSVALTLVPVLLVFYPLALSLIVLIV